MSIPASEKAVEQLLAQLESLRQYRNATTRDNGFRKWRQDTLTIVQRLWPADSGRWHRFRRVPFAPASPQAEDRIVRESFERGYSEMRRLLKMWIAEIKLNGLGGGAEPEPTEAAPKPVKEAGGKGKKRLKDMLGLADFDTEATGPAVPVEPVAGGATRPRPRDRTEPSAGPARPAAGSGQGLAETIAEALKQAGLDRPGPAKAKRGPTPEPQAASPQELDFRQTLTNLAGELVEIGVPAADRERLRGALQDLAGRQGASSPDWAMLQEAVALVMNHPAIARRALPLIILHFDRAA